MTIAVVQSKSASDVLPFTVTLDSAPTTGNLLIAVNAEGLGGDGGTFPEPSYAIGSAAGWTGVQNNTNVDIQYRVVAGGDPAGWAFESHSRPGDNDSARVTLIEISGDNLSEWTEGVGGDTSGDVSADLDLGSGSTGQGFLIGIASYATDGPDATALTDYTLLDDASIDDPDTGAGYAATIYRIVDPASGSFTIGATLGASAVWLMAAGAFIETTAPSESAVGLWIDWDGDGFGTGDHDDVTSLLISMSWNRGAAYEITGGAQSDQGIAVVRNPDGLFDPDNADGPLFGLLHDGAKVWWGVNEDGSIEFDPDKTIYGRFAGILDEVNALPVAGAGDSTPTAELVFQGIFDWMGRTHIEVTAAEGRTQQGLRQAILEADPLFTAGAHQDLAAEVDGLPISSASSDMLSALTAINDVNGTRHFILPSDVRDDWFTYVTRNRWYKIGSAADDSIDAASQNVTALPGWRVSSDTVVNQQGATVIPVAFSPAIELVWEYASAPLVITGPVVLWADFPDYVRAASLVAVTSAAVTTSLTSYGTRARIDLDTSDPLATFTHVQVYGYPVIRGNVQSYVANDTASQETGFRGVRAGATVTGDDVGTIAAATGIALFMVWKFANGLKRPSMTLANWIPNAFAVDLLDLLDFTSVQLKVTDLLFEIVGLSEVTSRAVTGGPVYYQTTFGLQESPVQTPTEYFTWDVSTWDGPDTWAYL